MGKNKKGGKRMSKKQMVELLENFFSSEPGQIFTLKEIFQDLKLNTHPLKPIPPEKILTRTNYINLLLRDFFHHNLLLMIMNITNMVQIYNKNPNNKQSQRKVI